MGSRFFISFISAFLLTMATLASAGYMITQIVVKEPRDPFRTGSFEFDLSPGWWCEPDGTEYVCTPPGKAPHAAIAIIAIKERNDKDNLLTYEQHLRQSQKLGGDKASNEMSEVRYVKRRMLGAHEWVEALHFGAEVQNFETYYLATATSHLGILVTMSVHKDHSAAYIKQMDDMMSTLNIYQR